MPLAWLIRLEGNERFEADPNHNYGKYQVLHKHYGTNASEVITYCSMQQGPAATREEQQQ